MGIKLTRRFWRYQRGNQNPYIEEEGQTTQWPKEKVQKDKQRSTKNTHKSKDQVTGTPLKTGIYGWKWTWENIQLSTWAQIQVNEHFLLLFCISQSHITLITLKKHKLRRYFRVCRIFSLIWSNLYYWSIKKYSVLMTYSFYTQIVVLMKYHINFSFNECSNVVM